MQWLDRIPWVPLALVAVFLGLAPLNPEPHVWQKLRMLAAGELVRPLDIFDLFFHGTPPLLLVLKAVRVAALRR